VKKSGRDEPFWIVIQNVHGSNARNISILLPLSQTSKTSMSFLLSHMFFPSTKLEKRAEQILPGSKGDGRGEGGGGVQEGEMAQTMYADMNK
jgi:hypothetical protein